MSRGRLVRLYLWLHRVFATVGKVDITSRSKHCGELRLGIDLYASILFRRAICTLCYDDASSSYQLLCRHSASQRFYWPDHGYIIWSVIFVTNLHSTLRQSAVWEHISFSGHFGLSIWSTMVYMIPRYSWASFPPGFVHVSSYFWAWVLVFAIISSPEERQQLQIDVLSFLLGALFRPFAFLFRNCFPEAERNTPRGKRLLYGFLIGMMLPAATTLFIHYTPVRARPFWLV